VKVEGMAHSRVEDRLIASTLLQQFLRNYRLLFTGASESEEVRAYCSIYGDYKCNLRNFDLYPWEIVIGGCD
jgi:hypothetical protein